MSIEEMKPSLFSADASSSQHRGYDSLKALVDKIRNEVQAQNEDTDVTL